VPGHRRAGPATVLGQVDVAEGRGDGPASRSEHARPLRDRGVRVREQVQPRRARDQVERVVPEGEHGGVALGQRGVREFGAGDLQHPAGEVDAGQPQHGVAIVEGPQHEAGPGGDVEHVSHGVEVGEVRDRRSQLAVHRAPVVLRRPAVEACADCGEEVVRHGRSLRPSTLAP
jgi:hypothetical protein